MLLKQLTFLEGNLSSLKIPQCRMNHMEILRGGPHKRLKTRAGKHMDKQKYEGKAYETAGRLHFFNFIVRGLT